MKSFPLMMHVTIFWLMFAIASPAMAQETVNTRIGELEFTSDWQNGYPTDETVTKLYDEMDFQRAVPRRISGRSRSSPRRRCATCMSIFLRPVRVRS